MVIPGTKPDGWKAKTEDYEYFIYGHHPVQAEGFVAGHPFYFRSKWDYWDFTVCTSHDFPDAGSSIEPPAGEEGFFRAGEYEGYRIGESYGTGTEASYLSSEISRTILESCLKRFLGDLRSR